MRVTIEYVPRGIGNDHDLKLGILHLQAFRFACHEGAVGEVLPDQLAAVLQALMHRMDELVDTGRHLVGIGLVRLQCRVDQRLSHHPVGNDQAGGQRDQDAG
ncbi:hypothetical protein D3C75_871450 [compost metagenome]